MFGEKLAKQRNDEVAFQAGEGAWESSSKYEGTVECSTNFT